MENSIHPRITRAVSNVNRSDTIRTSQTAELPYQRYRMRDPQLAYPSSNVSNLEDHTTAYQQRTSNQIRTQTYETTSHAAQTTMPDPDLEQNQRRDRLPDTAASHMPSVTPHHGSQSYQYRSGPRIEAPQSYSPPTAVMPERNISHRSTPLSSRTSLHEAPPTQVQEFSHVSPSPHTAAVQHFLGQSQGSASLCSPSPANTTFTPDRSKFGSPAPRMSPNSLQRELEGMEEYSENMLTRLMEREAEIEDLKRQLHKQGQALRAAQDDVVEAQSRAQYQQRQAERYSNEYFQLKESQNLPSRIPQQPEVNSAQIAEARKVTDFYMQKVDQLSRENMNISQLNRKLTEDLAVAQRNAQQQSSFVGSARQVQAWDDRVRGISHHHNNN